jgi:hypothetical protein
MGLSGLLLGRGDDDAARFFSQQCAGMFDSVLSMHKGRFKTAGLGDDRKRISRLANASGVSTWLPVLPCLAL